MISDIWLSSYKNLNNSYKKKMIFRLGADAGYFSEFNNMILAILFCLSRQIRFVLYSDSDFYSKYNAWSDFFEPFCTENHDKLNKFVNLRPYQTLEGLKNKIKIIALKKINNVNYLTQDFWHIYHDDKYGFSNEVFNVPELGIHQMNLLDSAKIIINNIWNYNVASLSKIDLLKKQINLPEKYISIHIRSGDKFLEKKLHSMHEYMAIVDNLGIKNVFVLTDDYRIIELLNKTYTSYNFFTLCKQSERGYFHQDFLKRSAQDKYLSHLSLFASVDVCAASEMFIGTYSSNPGMYMGMRIGKDRCIGIDYDNWLIW